MIWFELERPHYTCAYACVLEAMFSSNVQYQLVPVRDYFYLSRFDRRNRFSYEINIKSQKIWVSPRSPLKFLGNDQGEWIPILFLTSYCFIIMIFKFSSTEQIQYNPQVSLNPHEGLIIRMNSFEHWIQAGDAIMWRCVAQSTKFILHYRYKTFYRGWSEEYISI